MTQRTKMIFDMETGDPDDAMSLCVLATHPKVDLRAVTVFPGGKDQVGLAKRILEKLDRKDVLVGAGTPKKDSPRVSNFYLDWLGDIVPREPDGSAVEVIHAVIKEGATNLITGAALTNIHAALEAWQGEVFLKDWTCQGGFAGDNIVPPEYRLPKFEGRVTCPTFNFNGDTKAALALVATSRIKAKRFVTKNVCHGVFYDPPMHERIASGAHGGLDLLKDGMEVYFKKHPEGKALHDVIAVVLAIDPSAASWVLGFPYRERGEWGTRPDAVVREDGPYPVSISLDVDRFERVLAG